MARGRARGAVKALSPDFVLEVYQEKRLNNGEDAYYYAVGEGASVVGAFDGSGGSGARRYERWLGKTGAYLASRVFAGAVRDWYIAGDELLGAQDAAARLKDRAVSYLTTAKDACGGTSRIRGSLSKDFPTTCALVVLRRAGEGLEALSLYAGDSRCYMLDAQGLHQLSRDDLFELDAFENLSADGAMTNVVNASSPFEMHAHVVPVEGPCVLFAASDGCFGYLHTPMEFEYLLLETLDAAASPAEWERKLHAEFKVVANDDYTLCGLSVGYGSFETLKQVFSSRREEVYRRFVQGARELDTDGLRELWYQYKDGYYTLAPRG